MIEMSLLSFMLLWMFLALGSAALGWFLRGWYDKEPSKPPTPPDDFDDRNLGNKRGKW